MKKILLTILAIVYMAVTCGVAVELHYCMGSKAGMELYGSENEKCGKCGMIEKDTGCCHDEIKFYKINDSHKTASNDIIFKTPEFAVTNIFSLYNWQLPQSDVMALVNNHSPPGYTKPDVCIMNCVFRI